jgi:hypothetical protein
MNNQLNNQLNNNIYINDSFISGFVQADGSFNITTRKRGNNI